jgi:hypothetical protein
VRLVDLFTRFSAVVGPKLDLSFRKSARIGLFSMRFPGTHLDRRAPLPPFPLSRDGHFRRALELLFCFR